MQRVSSLSTSDSLQDQIGNNLVWSRGEVDGIVLDLWLLKAELNLGWLIEFLPGSAFDASLFHAVPAVASFVCVLRLSLRSSAGLRVGPLALSLLPSRWGTCSCPPFAAFAPALIQILFAVATGIRSGQWSCNSGSPSSFIDFWEKSCMLSRCWKFCSEVPQHWVSPGMILGSDFRHDEDGTLESS